MSDKIGDIVIKAHCPRCGQLLSFRGVSELAWAYDEPRLPSIEVKFALEPERKEDGGFVLHGGECGEGWMLR